MEAEFVLAISGVAILVGLWLVIDGWQDYKAVQNNERLRPFAIVYFVTQNALGLVQTIFFIVAAILFADFNVDVVFLMILVPVIILGVQLYTFFFKRRELLG